MARIFHSLMVAAVWAVAVLLTYLVLERLYIFDKADNMNSQTFQVELQNCKSLGGSDCYYTTAKKLIEGAK